MTVDAKTRVLIVLPDYEGGITRLFSHFRNQTQEDGHTAEIGFFVSHDQSRFGLLRFPVRLLRFYQELRAGEWTLCHINLASRGSTLRKFLFALICRLAGVPYVLHLHGALYREFFGGLPGIGKAIVRSMFRNAAGVLVLGRIWRQFVVEVIGVEPDRAIVLPNAVEGPAELAAKPDGRPAAILFLGQLGARKGVPELVEALASSQMQALDWTAVIAGDGDVAAFRKDATACGLSDRVTFPGWRNHAQTQALLASSDILVLPSHAENLPLSLLEGMGHGLCPVTTPVGAVPDVIRDTENGLLVPPGDSAALAEALGKVVADTALRKRLADAARRDFLAGYDIRTYRASMERAYAGILGLPPSD